MRIGLTQRVPPHRVVAPTDNVDVFKTFVLTSESGLFPAPTASLIEQKPGDIVRTHFHCNSQFQVFVHGSGLLGRKQVSGFVVQYVSAHTGYGPIVAGPDGIWYMTLRPSFPTTVAGYKPVLYLPESRPLMISTAERFQTHTDNIHLPAAQPSELQQSPLWAPLENGLAAWWLRIPPGATIDKPEHRNGLASYTLVAGGVLQQSGQDLPFLSVIWAQQGEQVALTAGSAGADVFVMQFPANAT